MKTSIVRIVCAVSVIAAIVGCNATPYQEIDGNWCYVTIDTGWGRQVRKLSSDATSFAVLPGGKYAKDSKHVFFKGDVVENADPATFIALPELNSTVVYYGKDQHRVFLRRLEIHGADPNSFRVLEGPYSRDAHRIYCGCVPMQVMNMEDFEVVHWSGVSEIGSDRLAETYGVDFGILDGAVYVTQGWARDGAYYYFGPGIVRGRDYATMQVLDAWHAQDKDGRFCGDLTIPNKGTEISDDVDGDG